MAIERIKKSIDKIPIIIEVEQLAKDTARDLILYEEVYTEDVLAQKRQDLHRLNEILHKLYEQENGLTKLMKHAYALLANMR